MEEKHKCKFCWKSFVNGRALGGHMRSHMLHHHPYSESASSSMADPVFALLDRESETESSKKLTRKRSRINRRSIYVSLSQPKDEEKTSKEMISESCTEQEPMMSSVSDAATEEEDLAFTLMMLSRDERDKEKEGEIKQFKKLYECETCKKVFKSYQALGGHRASHKKKRVVEGSASSFSTCVKVLVREDEKRKKNNGHECPICLKVFSSGQALGGHKRSHATGADNSQGKRGGSIRLIDLNLPAPSEDEDLISSVY